MGMRTILALGLACVCAGAVAGEAISIDQIAAEAGVSRRQVMMVLGDTTQYSEYRTSFDIVEPKVKAALQRLIAKRQAAEDAALVAGTTVEGEPGPSR